MPIFRIRQRLQSRKGIDTSSYKFLDWKKSVGVELTPETIFWLFSYMDTDKKLYPKF